MQARGDNLLSILKAFTNSSKLRTAQEREALRASSDDYRDEQAVFFDYLSWFMVCCKFHDTCSSYVSFCSATMIMTLIVL